MKVKSFSKLTISLALAFLAATLLAISPSKTLAQTETRKELLTLTVSLKDRETDFKLCMLVEVGSPFQAEWSNGLAKTKFSGLLREPKDNSYRLKFRIEEGTSKTAVIKVRESKESEEPELKFEEPYCLFCTNGSHLFGADINRSFLLSKYDCK